MPHAKSSPSEVPHGAVWLVDNGSLRVQSILALRRQARALSLAAGVRVEPVSVLHSSKVSPEALGGVAAKVFTAALRRQAEAGLRRLRAVPYFFGPSAALTDYLPEQVQKVRQDFPELYVEIVPPLVDLADPRGTAASLITQMLVRQIAETAAGAKLRLGDNVAGQGIALPASGGKQANEAMQPAPGRSISKDFSVGKLPEGCPAVVLVDHGSPQPAVSAVRDHVGQRLRECLAGRVRALGVASMEAREGAEFDHSRPLLAEVLAQAPFCEGNVIIAPLFLGPGRHAGEDGDLARIATLAQQTHPQLRTFFSPLAGETPEVTAILAQRVHSEQLLWCSHPDRVI